MIDTETMAPEETLQAPVETTETAAQKAFDELTKDDATEKPAKQAPKADKVEKPGKLPTTDPSVVKPFELPGYTARWNQSARDALNAAHGNPDFRKHIEPILAQLDETNKYVTTKEQETENFRKQVGPVWDIIGPLERDYRMQGMTLQQGVGQLVEAARFVASDPDQAFPWFSAMYRPHDPAKAVEAMAKQWGVNLGQMVEEAPYIDPHIQSLVGPLKEQYQALQARIDEQDSTARRAQQQQLFNAVQELEQAKDEAGNLRYPHLNTIAQDLILIANGKRAKNFDEAYAMAVRMNPELSSQVEADRAAAAQAKAIQEAASKSSSVQQHAAANRNVAGKGQRGSDGRYLSTEDAARAALAQLQSE